MTVFIAFAFQGSRGLYETTEGRYAEVSREMLETGNYLEPTLGYRPHWTKPPLTYWAIAGGIKLLGRNGWGVRFYNAVAFFFTVVMVAAIGETLWDRDTGTVSGWIYATSIFPVLGHNFVSTDMLLTLWETGAVLCYLKAGQTTGHAGKAARGRIWTAGMWLFFSLGFLTKGPPALLPLLAIGVWHYSHKKRFPIFTAWGIMIFIIIGCGWYVWVCYRHPALLNYFLGREVIARVTTGAFNRHAEWYKPFFIYLPILALGGGPWSWHLFKLIKNKRLFYMKVLFGFWRSGGGGGFLLVWTILPLTVLFMVKSRLPLYVLPLYAPVALAAGRGIVRQRGGQGKSLSVQNRRFAAAAIISGIILLGLKGGAAFYQSPHDTKSLYALCRKFHNHTNDTHFINFSGAPLYGLQFYLNGPLTRLSVNNRPWRDDTFESLIAKIKTASPSRQYLFITYARYGAELSKALEQQGFSSPGYRTKSWRLFLITPAMYVPPSQNVGSYEVIAG